MEARRLIPYSVHLPEDIYKKLKAAAGERKASALVRDAISLILDGGDAYANGYNKGLRDAIDSVNSNETARSLSINGEPLGLTLTANIARLMFKEKANGSKKTRRN